jgi:hypothetical protein
LIRGHPEAVPTKVGNYLKDWVPVFTGNPGFRLEFIPMKIGAGMTILIERAIYKQTLTNTNALNEMTSPPPFPSPLEGEGWPGGPALAGLNFDI